MKKTEEKKQNHKNPQNKIDEATHVKLIGEYEPDGTREQNKRLPYWLRYLFYASIIFTVIYLNLVFGFKDDKIFQNTKHTNNMAEATDKLEQEPSEETVAVVKTEADILVSGKKTYSKTCSVCHGKFGEGLVGSNLTDEYWIHGGSREDMRQIINNGMIEKGMISYKNQLSETQIQDVISYIQSLQGTNPPNQKSAEGEKYRHSADNQGKVDL